MVKQILKFGAVGFSCFFIDYILLIIFKEVIGIHYLIASGLSFVISLCVNYILSMKYVFRSKDDISKKREFTVFAVLSIFGLIINQVIMWFGVDLMNISYLIIKIFATGIVMIYNFISRKILLENKQEAV